MERVRVATSWRLDERETANLNWLCEQFDADRHQVLRAVCLAVLEEAPPGWVRDRVAALPGASKSGHDRSKRDDGCARVAIGFFIEGRAFERLTWLEVVCGFSRLEVLRRVLRAGLMRGDLAVQEVRAWLGRGGTLDVRSRAAALPR